MVVEQPASEVAVTKLMMKNARNSLMTAIVAISAFFWCCAKWLIVSFQSGALIVVKCGKKEVVCGESFV